MGIQVDVELFWRTDMQEWGLRACSAIPKDTVIGEYPGLYMTSKVVVADVRKKDGGRDSSEAGMLTGFDTTPSHFRIKPCAVELDAKKYHGVTYFINHACKDTNLKIVQFCDASRHVEIINEHRSSTMHEFRRMFFVTTTKIEVGEEFTFKYVSTGQRGKGAANTGFLKGHSCLCAHCTSKKKNRK